MLISFSVSNYRSIKNKITLSMLPAKAFKELPNNVFVVNTKFNLLRSAVIYGANASGKSNLLKAFEDFINFILSSTNMKIDQGINLFDPFLLDAESKHKPVKFEVDFLGNERIRYIYSFELTNFQIQKEELYCYPKGQKTKIFIREKGKSIDYGTLIKGEKKSVEARLLDNQLFLSKGANERILILQEVYKYFESNYLFLTQFKSFFSETFFSNILARMINDSPDELQKKLNDLIIALDTGIISYNLVKNDESLFLANIDTKDIFNKKYDDILKNEFNFDLLTVHNVYDKKGKIIKQVPFKISNESAGTRSLFGIALLMLIAIESGKIFVIDEVEQNLHPLLVNELIKLFHNPNVNKNYAQLICTTHNTNLLEDDILRRDQIWFSDKNEKGETSLYSLSDFDGIRSNIPYDKWYLSGRFGGTPIINDLKFIYRNDTQKKK